MQGFITKVIEKLGPTEALLALVLLFGFYVTMRLIKTLEKFADSYNKTNEALSLQIQSIQQCSDAIKDMSEAVYSLKDRVYDLMVQVAGNKNG